MPESPTPESQIPAFSPGRDLAGRYRLIESLFTTWSEETWAAYDVQTSSQVAVHVLPYLFVAEQQGLQELKQRGARLQAVPHPGLVRSLDFFVTPEAACYVTELLRGSTLAELRQRLPSGVFEPGEIIDWLGGATAALRHLHNYGWAHGDLHPGQMLIDPGGRLRLTGLGIAQIVSEVHFPENGPFALAHSCKSPQQVAGEMAAPADDIYALGASIFYLLTGQLVTSPLLYRGESAMLPPMAEVCARLGMPDRAIDPAWDRLVRQCLATPREERPTVDRLREPLLALKLQPAATPPGAPPTPPAALTPPSALVPPTGFAPLLSPELPMPVPPSVLPERAPQPFVEEQAPLPVLTMPPVALTPPAVTLAEAAPEPLPEAPAPVPLPSPAAKSSLGARLATFVLIAGVLGGAGLYLWRKTHSPAPPATRATPGALATPEEEWQIVEPSPTSTPVPEATPQPTPRPLTPPPSTPGTTPAQVVPPAAPVASTPPSGPALRGTFRPPLVPPPPSLPSLPPTRGTPSPPPSTPAPDATAQAELSLLERSRRAASASASTSLPPMRQLSESELSQIGKRLWKNEGAGTTMGLTSWRPGDAFATLGIGRFTWYPAGATSTREETFPDLMQYFAGHGVAVPAWMNATCPWPTRDAFLEAFQEPQMNELRELLKSTIPLQTRLLTERLRLAVASLTSSSSPEERTQIEAQYTLLSKSPRGIFAMVDFLTAHGPGASAGSARTASLGLLQALLDNKGTSADDAADRFSDAAERVLLRRPSANAEQQRERINRVRGYSAEW